MLDRIFHQRLEDQGRYRQLSDCFLNVKVDLQAFTESDLFYFQISFQKRDLFVDRTEGAIVISQHMPENFCQPNNHFLGRSGVCGNQCRHTVQGVEQKVRIDLSAEGTEFRFHQLFDELCLPASPFDILSFAISCFQAASDGQTDFSQEIELRIK